ncbi:tripartite tricarboxylate transporter TctB family protein [Pacificoceanicola onchidii]|uniref:tripartite tricarboxylate transporter TctB family protein n=1 Tax=Pacificoceanicola onchidii TaxID=2562685 RepID=UPI0010A6A0ED|nr:tripartite tricarboxylate transporter TctB family protein [Pacificoceanicola onchidii]
MLSQRWSNIVFAILILIGAAWFAWVAQGFEAAGLLASSGLPSKFFPQLLLAGMAICAVIVLVVYLVKGAAGKNEDTHVYGSGAAALRGLSTLVAVVAGYFIWRTWGFEVMAVFIGPATLLTMGERNPVIYGIVLALAGGVYLVFTQLLGTQF